MSEATNRASRIDTSQCAIGNNLSGTTTRIGVYDMHWNYATFETFWHPEAALSRMADAGKKAAEEVSPPSQ